MLDHLLEARGIKCADLTKATGIGQATLSSVLAGRRGLSKANILKLAGYFRVSPVVFLDGAGSARRKKGSRAAS